MKSTSLLVSLGLILLGGCTLWDNPDAFLYSGQAADVVSTSYAVCGASNYVEANPLYTLSGEGCGEVLASVLLFKAGMVLGLRALCKPEECPTAWRTVGAVGWGQALWNSSTLISDNHK